MIPNMETNRPGKGLNNVKNGQDWKFKAFPCRVPRYGTDSFSMRIFIKYSGVTAGILPKEKSLMFLVTM